MLKRRPILTYKYLLIVYLLLFAYISVNQSFAQYKLDAATERQLQELNGQQFREKVAKLYDSIKLVKNPAERTALASIIFRQTQQKDERAHINSLMFRKMHTLDDSADLFKEAEALAKRINDFDGICLVAYSRANYFLAQKRYDSAMYYLLRYRDLTPPDSSSEGYRNIINLMGDIYYYAGLYEEAKRPYKQLLEYYQKENNWNHYRPYVLMNNMGQIALNQKDTDGAKRWFLRSLNLATTHLKADYQHNTKAYIHARLAEAYMHQDSLDQAANFLAAVAAFPSDKVDAAVWQEYLWQHANLYFLQKDYTAAREKLISWRKFKWASEINSVELSKEYELLSSIYEAEQQYDSSLYYNKLYLELEREITTNEYLAQSMIILSDRNHELTRLELIKTQKYNRTLIISLIIVGLLLVSIVVLAYRLHRSKVALINQYLAGESKRTLVRNLPKHDISPNNPEVISQSEREKDLITQLEEYMDSERPFLNHKYGLLDATEALKTNRTYLSQAINNQLGTTFPLYINELRIKEAVKLITSGYVDGHTQEALARECGFTSRSTFIAAFKKVTGVVPSFFIANHKKSR